MYLMPVCLQEWLPPDHLAYFISDVVEYMDLSDIMSRYEDEERGYPPYHPKMMVKVLLYAYCAGVPSSRKIEKRLKEDIAFRVLAANNTPDFRTISDFRKDHLEALAGLFLKVLKPCQKAGLVKLGHVSLKRSIIERDCIQPLATAHRIISRNYCLIRRTMDYPARPSYTYLSNHRGAVQLLNISSAIPRAPTIAEGSILIEYIKLGKLETEDGGVYAAIRLRYNTIDEIAAVTEYLLSIIENALIRLKRGGVNRQQKWDTSGTEVKRHSWGLLRYRQNSKLAIKEEVGYGTTDYRQVLAG